MIKAITASKKLSIHYRTTGDPYLDVLAAVVRRAIQDVRAGNGHAEDAARFLQENDRARVVVRLAQERGYLAQGSCHDD